MVKFNVDIPWEELSAPEQSEGYSALQPRSEVLVKGSCTAPGRLALPCDILVEHDATITVRDGCKLYADIYRPPGAADRTTPAVLCWSPFGKKFNGIQSLKLMTPWNLGIPEGALSGLEKFEAPDPAEFVDHGYAIVNIDSRGAFDSEGRMAIMGTQEAEDGYDVVEWLAKQDWCNGKVGMAGNSHLAIIQWFVAALQPPSLKAIAPWEGCGDLYREQFARGGIYGGDLFDHLIIKYMLRGRHGIESFRKMFEQHPRANDWWNDKRADMTKINIPTYITGTYTNTMHGMGAIRGWLEVNSPDKWLRWHPYQEWYDIWGNLEGRKELLSFFDRYLKDIDNGWESTPRVRMSLLKFGEKAPIENIIESDFPPPRTEYRKAYLTPGGLSFDKPTGPDSAVSYNSQDAEAGVTFKYTFRERTQIMGVPKAVLYMRCDDLDDMDVFLVLEKISSSGERLLNLNIPWKNVPVSSIAEIPEKERTEVVLYQGPTGILRASNRDIDSSRSIHPNWPFYTHEKEEKVAPGTVVRLEIGIWVMGVEYEAGESIQLRIGGRYQGISNFGQDHTLNRVYTGCIWEENMIAILSFPLFK